MRGDRPQGTKLLVATIGLATVSYVGCGNSRPPGNLMSTPEPTETATATPDDHPPGNLMAPPEPMPTQSAVPTASETVPATATATVATSATASAKPTATAKIPTPKDFPHGNLMAPPPPPPKK
jgi:hypothetical protein